MGQDVELPVITRQPRNKFTFDRLANLSVKKLYEQEHFDQPQQEEEFFKYLINPEPIEEESGTLT